jgi:hypothetical protein
MSLRVYRRHLYHDTPKRQFCSRGARAFFARHGLDWRAFIRDGIAADALLATGDAMAARSVQHALEETNGHGQQ